jgi:hypothetical protein
MNRPLACKYNWLQNLQADDKTVLKPLSYYYQTPYDEFRPVKSVTPHIIYNAQLCARYASHAGTGIGSFPYSNTWFAKKVRQARGA